MANKPFSEAELEQFEKRFPEGALFVWHRPDGALGINTVNPKKSREIRLLRAIVFKAMPGVVQKCKEAPFDHPDDDDLEHGDDTCGV